MKTGFRLALVAGALAAAAAAGALAPHARADAVEDKLSAFKEYLKTNPAPDGIKNKVAELCLECKDERTVEVLMPLVRNPKMDEDVKVTVLENVGKLGVKAVGATLMSLADSKPWEEKPKLIAAAYRGAGDAD